MSNIRLSRGLCAVVGESLLGSHATLDALFTSAGAPGEPPDLAHHSKWKEWAFRAGQDVAVDSLSFLGNVLEEFMDVTPLDNQSEEYTNWVKSKARIESTLEANGLEYYQGGRVIPNGKGLGDNTTTPILLSKKEKLTPSSVDELLKTVVRGLPRAIYPLSYRRKGATSISFSNEYDVQDLLHVLLRPWVADIRAEEYTPSYAGSSTRMDFLLPAHSTVIETKIVRDKNHAKRVGDELIIDIAHYRAHQFCDVLWCVIYDPQNLIVNVDGLKSDLEGCHNNNSGSVQVILEVV
ncbi:MAG: transposase [Litorimonas sp.]